MIRTATYTFKHAALLFVLAVAPTGAFALDPDLRDKLLTMPETADLGGETSRPLATWEAYTFINGNAPDSVKDDFAAGNILFNLAWAPAPGLDPTADGLGPTFNSEACSDCHTNNGRGQPPVTVGGLMDTILIRLSVPGVSANGGPVPVPGYGDQLQDRAIEGVPPEGRAIMEWSETAGTYGDGTPYSLRTPTIRFEELSNGPLPEDVLISPRVANPIIGLGLLERVPEEVLQGLADDEDADGDGISGRVNMAWNIRTLSSEPGRFGWKANVPTLIVQNTGAALNDMGITNPIFRADMCQPGQDACAAAAVHRGPEMSGAQLLKLNGYTQRLAVPRQRYPDRPEVQRGAALFVEAGCHLCHVPTLVTDNDTGKDSDLAGQTFHPFTDLLLHDMGPGLSDGRPDYMASGSEWRTPPLWGIGLSEEVSGHNFFLHDGRARGLAEAILWHGGEGEAAKERFRTMDKSSRDDLIAFLKSL